MVYAGVETYQSTEMKVQSRAFHMGHIMTDTVTCIMSHMKKLGQVRYIQKYGKRKSKKRIKGRNMKYCSIASIVTSYVVIVIGYKRNRNDVLTGERLNSNNGKTVVGIDNDNGSSKFDLGKLETKMNSAAKNLDVMINLYAEEYTEDIQKENNNYIIDGDLNESDTKENETIMLDLKEYEILQALVFESEKESKVANYIINEKERKKRYGNKLK